MKSYKIVIADRENVLLDFQEQFEKDGFVFSVSRPGAGASTPAFADELVRLDLLLPEECMNSALISIHALSHCPFFLFVARIENADQLCQFEEGVQRTLDKLNIPRAAVYCLNEKSDQNDMPPKHGISIIPNTRKVFINESEIFLTPIEFDLLHLMISKPDNVFTRCELSMMLSKSGPRISLRSINSHIYHLRKKISRFLPGREIIRTIYGIGYALKLAEEKMDNSTGNV